MRINKLFSNYGICSRKETNKLIEEKRIKINGEYCALGQWVEEGKDEILLDDKPISKKEKVYIALNKPVGITCTSNADVKDNIIEFMNYPEYIFPVGRLDKESQGLIIMTNDGELANVILESDNMHEKEYIVEVNKNFDDEFLKQMAEGVEICGYESSGVKRISDTFGVYKSMNYEKNHENEMQKTDLGIIELKDILNKNANRKSKIKTRPCRINRISENRFSIILTQGLNRQIRKMSGVLGFKVIRLERTRIVNINLGDLEYGKWRYLSGNEIEQLKKQASLKI